MKKNSVVVKVVLAIIFAVIAGLLTGSEAALFGITFVRLYSLIGQLFLNALNLVVVPLVISSIISGTGRMGQDGAFGSMGLRTLTAFFFTMFSAILVGFLLVTWIAPGVGQTMALWNQPAAAEHIAQMANSQDTFDKISQIFLQLVPSNIIAVAAQGQMLGIIVFSLLFGYFVSKLESDLGSMMINFWKGVFQVMMSITQLIMKALPIGVFGLVAKVVATTGLEAFSSVGLFTLTVVLGLIVYGLGVLSLMLKFIGRINPLTHLKNMGPALITAFSTSSSAGSLPVSLECVEKGGVSHRLASFILPLGTSLNTTGSALQICVTVFFIAQAYGIEMSVPTQILVFMMTLVTSFGMAGIPSASLIAIVMILQTIGLPADAIGLVMAVERLLDMMRTAVNVYGTSCCAVMVANAEVQDLQVAKTNS